MKYLTVLMALTLSTGVFAQKKVEFDEGQEKTCYETVRKQGCLNSDGSAKLTCVKAKKSSFSTNCRQILGI